MAQYSVTHTCGHTTTHQLVGKTTDRDRRIDWLKGRDCLACHRAAETAAAAAQAEAQQLPPLSGSDKQIAWAERIRADQLTQSDRFWADYQRKAGEFFGREGRWPTDEERAQMDTWESAIAHLRGQASAAWWIDHRHDSARALIVACSAAVVRQ